MNKIRTNTFETNSSSTHVLCIPKENSKDEIDQDELYVESDFTLLSAEVFTSSGMKLTALVHMICSQYYSDIEYYDKDEVLFKLEKLKDSAEEINWNNVFEMVKSSILGKKTVSRLKKLEEILHRQGIKYHIGDWAYEWTKSDDGNEYCNYNVDLDGRQPMDGVDWLLEDDNRLLNYLSNKEAFYGVKYDDFVFPDGIDSVEEAEKKTHYFYNGG